ncbi:DUF2977 domain-containing protein [Lactobacillus sp. 3B(2020)]|uniref:DUF2977 domain-containing protein n=1 Tax=Lactobacillus sp. 3B(2020) TaxID=2695882 RepID=UPI0015DDCB46|nr:DUF2977 domain-containing protein [Lactobacillus sp. 3B(2020)]QLL69799.1 DUF2977 domain-containing protein [Lactobacillus sp. 3B(2020)]
MKLVVNGNLIIGYCSVGDLPGTIEYTGDLPTEFQDNFASEKYLYQDGKVIINDQYEAPKPSIPGIGITGGQKVINQLGAQVANLTTEIQSLKKSDQEMSQIASSLGMQVAQLLAKEQGGN